MRIGIVDLRNQPAQWWVSPALQRALMVSFLMAPAAWPQACTPAFVITPTPNGPQHNRLKGVSTFAINDIWAVGFTMATTTKP